MSLITNFLLISLLCCLIVFAGGPSKSGADKGSKPEIGVKKCFDIVPITLKSGKQLKAGYKNVGKCSCADAKKEADEIAKHISDQFNPACDKSGAFKAQQLMMVGGFCVDTKTGDQISEPQRDRNFKC